MDDKNEYRFVEFDKYCDHCTHQTESEHEEKSPCYECIATPVNLYTSRPINFEERMKTNG